MRAISESKLQDLGEFLSVLHARGWAVTLEHHARMARLLELLGQMGPDYTPARLKNLLCPIFATDAAGQEAFGAAYDDYFQPPVPMPPAQRKVRSAAERHPIAFPWRERWPVIAAAAAIVMVVAFGAHWTSLVDTGGRDQSGRHPSTPGRPLTAQSGADLNRVVPEADATAAFTQDAAASALAAVTAPGTAAPETVDPFAELMLDGRMFRKTHLNATALATFRAAATMAPGNPAPLAEIATTYEEMGLRGSAKQEWQKIYDMGPVKAGVYHELAGVMLNKLGSLALGVQDRSARPQTAVKAPAEAGDNGAGETPSQSMQPPSPPTAK